MVSEKIESNSDKIAVTVIIPTYNVEKFIGECIASLVKQTYKKIEIVVVDDGSNDGTIDIIDDYKNNDNRIRLIRQEHGGPNIARKKGVELAEGEYVMFVDADDYLDTTAIATLVSHFEKEDVDSIKYGAKRFPGGTTLPSVLTENEKSKVFEREGVIRLLLMSGCLNNLFSQIYKTCFLRDISAFENGVIFGEDLLVNFEVHQKMGRMLAIDDVLYYYRNNPTSTTNSARRERIVGNVIDRVYVSSVLIGYALQEEAFRDDITRIVFYQLSMIRDAMVGLARIKGYSREDFYKDLSRMDLADKINVPQIDKNSLYSYISGLSFTKRIKNQGIIKGIVDADNELLWRSIRRYKPYWRLKELAQKWNSKR